MATGVPARIGGPGEVLSAQQITEFVRGQLDAVPLDGARHLGYKAGAVNLGR